MGLAIPGFLTILCCLSDYDAEGELCFETIIMPGFVSEASATSCLCRSVLVRLPDCKFWLSDSRTHSQNDPIGKEGPEAVQRLIVKWI